MNPTLTCIIRSQTISDISPLSAGGRCRATTTHVLAAPCELADGPLLDEAMVAPMVAGVTIVRQRSRRGRGRGWCWRRCGRAALALRPAAESLLALGPSALPVREACRAIVWARSGRATDVMMSAAPNLLSDVPALRRTNGAVWLRRGCGRRRRRRRRRMRRRMRRRGATDAIVLAAPVFLVQAPESLALAAIWFGGRCGDVLRRCGRDDDLRRGCCRRAHQHIEDDPNKADRHNAIAPALPDVRWHCYHRKLS